MRKAYTVCISSQISSVKPTSGVSGVTLPVAAGTDFRFASLYRDILDDIRLCRTMA